MIDHIVPGNSISVVHDLGTNRYQNQLREQHIHLLNSFDVVNRMFCEIFYPLFYLGGNRMLASCMHTGV